MKNKYILDFADIDKALFPLVGGKAANLGELSRIEGIRVPPGFCVATTAYKELMTAHVALQTWLDRLAAIKPGDRKSVGEISATIRALIESIPVPAELTEAVAEALRPLDERKAFAIRSSATAEDLPTASFAGQQDTFLNIAGLDSIMLYIRKCWASLFTERAVIYRIQHGFDHRKIQLSVVVQQMVFPQVSGIMFTADPVSGNRKIISIDASFGLGDALVFGLVNPDVYKIRDSILIDKKIAGKNIAIYAAEKGGTVQRSVDPGMQYQQALTEAQIGTLERIGRKIEAHFGSPQDIEWCLSENVFYMVQSRPITTLFPVPEVNDSEKHVYVSVGHQQMMTDAMKPLGLSFYNLNAGREMFTAGGRLFVDVAKELSTLAGRAMMIDVLGKSDPLIKGAFETIIDRGFIPLNEDRSEAAIGSGAGKVTHRDFQALNDYDPSVVDELIRRAEVSIAALKDNIQSKSGVDLFDFIVEDIRQSRAELHDQRSFSVIMTGMNASHWLNEKLEEWLGEKNAADTLSLSVAHNITSEMGLALMDVADVVRLYPDVVAFLEQTRDDRFLEQLHKRSGGTEVRNAMLSFLDKYGMRCPGEIDITRPRWAEQPLALVPAILNNVRLFAVGASKRKFAEGREVAAKKKKELLAALIQLPDGEQKVKETKRMIDLVRHLIGYREFPKYAIVSRSFVYKQALLKEAEPLVQAGVLRMAEDIFYLSFAELSELVRSRQLDDTLIDKRKEAYRAFKKLRPPRVMTSEGEVIIGSYKRENLPEGALAGLPVATGVVEGRARVILNMEEAVFEEGDILVTAFTDPSWTPLFVSIKGLVTEVGGLMTHGAVIAREYGLPAVVGLEHATRLIKDGQRIRVDGTHGWVEVF